MSYTSRNPQHASVVLDDISSATPSNPPASKHKLIDRDGGLYLRNSAGIERRLAYGEAEINYIKNPNTVTSWGLVGDLNLSTTTTAAELPRENTTPSGIKITATSGAQTTVDYVYFDINLDDSDLNRILKISWDQKKLATYADGQLAVVITTQADRTTVVSTPSVSAIPAQDGTFAATFLSGSTATLSLVIRATGEMTTDDGIVISNVIVGPGTLVQGAPVGDWIAVSSPTLNSDTGVSSKNLKYRRVGDSLEAELFVSYNNTGDNSNFEVTLPNSLVVDTSKLPSASAGGQSLGVGLVYLNSDSKFHAATACLGTTTSKIGMIIDEEAARKNSSGFGNGSQLNIRFTVPIVGWSSNIYLGSGADGTSVLDWTSFTPTITASGGGSVSIGTGGGATAVGYYRRVGDSAEVTIDWLFGSSGAAFGSSGTYYFGLPGSLVLDTAKVTGREIFGNGVVWDSNVDDPYGFYVGHDAAGHVVAVVETGTSILNVGTTTPFTMAAGDFIRLRFTVPVVGWTSADYLGKMLTGFSSAIVGRSGLVNNDAANTAGTPIKGRTSGNAISAGYVGETIESLGVSVSATTSSYKTITSIALTAGLWEVTGNAIATAAASLGSAYIGLATATDSTTGWYTGQNTAAWLGSSSYSTSGTIMPFRYSFSSNTTLYLTVGLSGANTTVQGSIRAVRIA